MSTDIRNDGGPAAEAAIRTLEAKGYTFHGGEYWKPPLGKDASPLLDRIDALSAESAQMAEALKPFALVAEQDISPDEADIDRFVPMSEKNRRGPRITVGHMRRAREAFAARSSKEA